MASEPSPEGLPAVIAAGVYRDSLVAIRDRLAEEATRAEGSALAAVTKQLTDVLGRLETMPVKEGSTVDDLAAQRAVRRGAQVPEASSEGVKRGTGGGRTRSKRGAAS